MRSWFSQSDKEEGAGVMVQQLQDQVFFQIFPGLTLPSLIAGFLLPDLPLQCPRQSS